MDQISKKIKMISKKLKELKNKFYHHEIDGYLVPKNDEYFSEFAKKDKLKTITGFDGSFGLAIILKKKTIFLLMGDILSKLKFRLVKSSKYWKYQKNFPIKF